MKSTTLLAALAALTITGCAPMLAGDCCGVEGRGEPVHHVSGFDHGMKPVSNPARTGARAHGWRYFSDPATYRAVVISPQGDYYLSGGQGLRWVAGTQTGI